MTVDIPPSRGWRTLQALLFALAGGALAAWGAGHLEVERHLERSLRLGPDAAAAVGLAVLTSAVLAAGLGWWLSRSQTVRLSWNGDQWAVACPPTAPFMVVRPMVTFDLGGALLLHLAAEGGAVMWVVATRPHLQGQWGGLRATLQYGIRESAPPTAP